MYVDKVIGRAPGRALPESCINDKARRAHGRAGPESCINDKARFQIVYK